MTTDPQLERRPGKLIDQGIGWIEDVLYVVIAVVLTVAAVSLVVVVARDLPDLFTSDSQDAALGVLDVVLLIFIVVELLFAVRETVLRSELVAEPFLLVGIIASIKEIVVLSVKAAESSGSSDSGRSFQDDVTLIGVLGVLVLLLSVAAFLLRRKEREPDEGQEPGVRPGDARPEEAGTEGGS